MASTIKFTEAQCQTLIDALEFHKEGCLGVLATTDGMLEGFDLTEEIDDINELLTILK